MRVRRYRCWAPQCGRRWFDTLKAADKECAFCGSLAITHALEDE